jgi:hypothetical protein
MDCVKLYFKDSLIGVLTFNQKKNVYIFVKNKFFNNKYINEVVGLNDHDEVYLSSGLFSFFFSFLNRYSNHEYDNEYEELVRIASLDFDKNQFWIGV